MSEQIYDGGPAFPIPDAHFPNGEIQFGCNGMTLRDWFAGQALAGMLSRGGWEAEGASIDAFMYADAMLAARKETR